MQCFTAMSLSLFNAHDEHTGDRTISMPAYLLGAQKTHTQQNRHIEIQPALKIPFVHISSPIIPFSPMRESSTYPRLKYQGVEFSSFLSVETLIK